MATRTTTRTAPPRNTEPSVDASGAKLFDTLMRIQALQIGAFLSWQQAIIAMHDELRDEWICRWAGGVPLDA